MFPLFYKKRAVASFEIDHPKFSITPNSQNIESLLKSAGIKYNTVTDGYITFCGQAFDSDIPLMIGIHFNSHKVEFIEIFRTLEYYQSEGYDINVSFAELSNILKKKYGKPLVTTSASISGYPCEQWTTPNFIINHYIMDRFGPEEHLHINFYKK